MPPPPLPVPPLPGIPPAPPTARLLLKVMLVTLRFPVFTKMLPPSPAPPPPLPPPPFPPAPPRALPFCRVRLAMLKLVEAVLVRFPPAAAGVLAAIPMKKMRSPVVALVEPPSMVIAPWPPLAPSMRMPFGLVRIGSIEESVILPPPEILKRMIAAPESALAELTAERSAESVSAVTV